MVKKKETKGLWKNCVKCEGRYLAKRKDQKYCTDLCREEYYQEHYFAKVFVDKVCPNCGNTFPTSMPKKQTYCTSECRDEAKKKRVDMITAQTSAERATYLSERYATLERDKFKCTLCGRGVPEDATLDVEEHEGKLRTICVECKTGKEVTHD